MSEPSQSGTWCLVIGAAMVGLTAWIIHQAQENNQVVRPLPGGKPAPVVPHLPNVAAYLRQTKSLSEDCGHRAGKVGDQRRISGRQVEQGRRLFEEARAEHAAAIEFLCVGLDRRFDRDDPARVRARLQEVKRKVGAFIAWANSIEQLHWGEGNPWTDLLAQLQNWLDGVSRANEEAVARIKADLRACGMAAWNEL